MYRFIVAAYTNCTAGDFYSGYREATCAPTSHGRQAFTSSGTFTVPSGVRSINIHCTGGGGNGQNMHYYSISEIYGGCGGGGGYTSYTNNIPVSPGTQIPITVGGGAAVNGENANAGGTSSAIVNNVTYQAIGGNKKQDGSTYRAFGGSGAGYSGIIHNGQTAGSAGGSDGSDGNGPNIYSRAQGQGTTTKEFGTGTLYSGGGGGGGVIGHGDSDEDTDPYAQYGAGGAGGGGRGGGPSKTGLYAYSATDYTGGSAGSAGTGGGGGGGGYAYYDRKDAQPGGSGNVIITW